MAMQEPTKIVNNGGKETLTTKCPRCGTLNRLVRNKDPDYVMVNEIVYVIYKTVCYSCGLLYVDAFTEITE